MNFDNYDDLRKFVEDNWMLFENNNVHYTKDSQKAELKKQQKTFSPKYDSNTIKKAMNDIFDEKFEEKKEDIKRIYKENRFDKEKTQEHFQDNRFLSRQRILKELNKLDKEIDLIFVDKEFSEDLDKLDKVDELEEFCRNNIAAFNASPSRFNKKNLERYIEKRYANFDKKSIEIHYKSDVDRCLKDHFYNLKYEEKEEIFNYFLSGNTVDETKSKFCKKYILRASDIEEFIKAQSFKNLSQDIPDEDEFVKKIVGVFKEEVTITGIERDLERILKRFLPLILTNGFAKNMTNVDSGIMVANAGDSAQFLFIARSILAGFDSSNVDVRSSRYDCIVDYKGEIFKVQVKGISDDTVHYKDRDRGGSGIDYTDKRNRGKRITKEDCDIYAAVYKKTGVVYLVPINYLEDSGKDSENIATIKQFRENWSIFEELYSKGNKDSVE